MEIVDNYEHLNSNCIYVVENVESASTESKLNNYFTEGCKCEGICSKNSCECLQRSGAYYIKSNDNKDLLLCRNSSNKPIYECNINCNCIKTCGNRVVQLGPSSSLKIIDTEVKGFGLISLNRRKVNSFICEYAGELISPVEAEIRYDIQRQNNEMNYILYVKEYFGETEICTIIDPSKFGNIGRYINHSCNPNCEIIPIRINNDVPKLSIFTKRDVSENEELTYDYGDGNLGFKMTEANLRNKIICRCGEKCCRQYLPYCADLDKIL